jgi:hypothetical protein
MKAGAAWRLLGLAAVLPGALSCLDAQLPFCITVTSCATGDTITGAHVRIHNRYQEEDFTGPDGRWCAGGFAQPFQVDADKPGYAPKTAGPFTRNGTDEIDVQICLDPG